MRTTAATTMCIGTRTGDKRSDYYLMFEDGYLTIDDGGERTNMPMGKRERALCEQL